MCRYTQTYTNIHTYADLDPWSRSVFTIYFLRANLKHLEKNACQNHDSESLWNATRAHKNRTPALNKTTQTCCHVKTAQICFLIFWVSPLKSGSPTEICVLGGSRYTYIRAYLHTNTHIDNVFAFLRQKHKLGELFGWIWSTLTQWYVSTWQICFVFVSTFMLVSSVRVYQGTSH